jgi:ferredoxin
MAVELTIDAADVLKPLVGVSQIEKFKLFGIHFTKGRGLLLYIFRIASSTSVDDIFPRKMAEAAKQCPFDALVSQRMLFF